MTTLPHSLLSEQEILSVRDNHLPSQGEAFDTVAFARAIESAALAKLAQGVELEGFRLTWHSDKASYTVSKPNIDTMDVVPLSTAQAAVAAERLKTAEAEAKLDAMAKESIELAARNYAGQKRVDAAIHRLRDAVTQTQDLAASLASPSPAPAADLLARIRPHIDERANLAYAGQPTATEQEARELLRLIDASPAPAAEPVPDTPEQRVAVVAAWNDLPDYLRCHPCITALYQALGGTSGQAAHFRLRDNDLHSVNEVQQATPSPSPAATVLRQHAEGREHHLNRGTCPDHVAGHDSRDEDCPVCRALGAAPSPAVPADRAGLVEECKRLAAFVLHYQRRSEQYSGSSEQYLACQDHVRNGTEDLHAALDRLASAPAQVAEGWQLVPKVPTQEMCAAAVVFANGNAVYKNVTAEVLKIEEGIYGEAYAAMLAAAPAAEKGSL